mgnify:CR=1 FL=1
MDFSATKFMVVGDYGGKKSLEMIDLEDPGNSCLFQDFPIKVNQGMGQQTPNGLFYCGGWDDSIWSVVERCFKFEETKFVDDFSKPKRWYYQYIQKVMHSNIVLVLSIPTECGTYNFFKYIQ